VESLGSMQANQEQGEERLMRSWGVNTDDPKYIKQTGRAIGGEARAKKAA
jgi:hypothetical protein